MGYTARPGGRLAQLVERLVYTEDVSSSSLLSPTIFHQWILLLAGHAFNNDPRRQIFPTFGT